MVWILALIAVVVLGLAALATSGRLGELPPLVDDRPGPELPDGPIRPSDIEDVTFAVVPRGYSMSQVDDLLARVREQWEGDRRQADGPLSAGHGIMEAEPQSKE